MEDKEGNTGSVCFIYLQRGWLTGLTEGMDWASFGLGIKKMGWAWFKFWV